MPIYSKPRPKLRSPLFCRINKRCNMAWNCTCFVDRKSRKWNYDHPVAKWRYLR